MKKHQKKQRKISYEGENNLNIRFHIIYIIPNIKYFFILNINKAINLSIKDINKSIATFKDIEKSINTKNQILLS